jgi:hypothetical protein
MEQGPSALELLHPDGVARHTLVIGDGCPEVLRPRRPEPGAEQRADLLILAPTRAELRERNWLRDAADSAAAALAPDGVVYVLSPPRARARLRRLLAARGIEVTLAFVHDPSTSGVRCLVPVSPAAAAYAFTNLIATRPRRRRLALVALRARWFGRVLSGTLPHAGLAFSRPASRPLFAWLFASNDRAVRASVAVVTIGHRRVAGSVVAHGLANETATPTVVAKVGSPGPTGPTREAAILEGLAVRARAAGATVPEVLGIESDARRAVLFETPVPGRQVAAVLGEAPAQLTGLTRRLAEWLEGWNLDTRTMQLLSAEWLEEELAGPARALAPALSDGGGYLRWLESRCDAVAGTRVPLVATHNDLTMVNVFVERTGSLGVVDWEDAREQGFPLVDFYYAAADATAAADRYADRAGSFRRLFGEAASSTSTRMLEQRLVEALDLRPAVAELAFHACWIQHAAAEQRAGLESRQRPFLEILRSVAETTTSRSAA